MSAPDETIVCHSCGQGIQSSVDPVEGELELSCLCGVERFPADEYTMEELPPEPELPDYWEKRGL